MKIAIMQPYLFPYIGYWQLLNTVDTFVVYDNIQFMNDRWFHRNNILVNQKKKLFTIPIKKDSHKLNVVDRYISDKSHKNIQVILAQINNEYRKARYFNNVFPLIKSIFLHDEKNLFKYVYNSIIQVCNHLDIKTKIVISSNIDINHNLKKQSKVIAINKSLNSTQYINMSSGYKLYDLDKFQKENIQLKFLKPEYIEYKQNNDNFIPFLSIIDVMMFNSKEETKKILSKFKFM
jgi:hypothetical protein